MKIIIKPGAHAITISGALLCFWGLTLAGAVQAQAPLGAEALKALAQAERQTEFAATQTITRTGEQPMTMRVWRSGFRRRWEWQSPPVMRGDVLVDNGVDVWRYYRAENEAIGARSTVGAVDLEQLTQGFEAKMQGSGEAAGRPAWIVNILPRGQNRPVRRVWIDRATKIRLRSERLDARGQAVDTWALSNIDFGPVPVTQFRWTPPDGVKVTRTAGTLWTQMAPAQKAVSWLQVPPQNALPRGYVFESAVVDGKSGQGEAWLRYTNGLNRVSIFQQRAPGADDKDVQKVDGAWFWTRHNARFLVAGLDEKDVQTLVNEWK